MAPGAEPPRWLVDEMLGRLARYLRFFGHDTVYARDVGDASIAAQAAAERRILITRDRRLAAEVGSGALWVGSSSIDDQLRAVRARFPTFDYRPRFDRCTICNGRLQPFEPERGDPPDPPIAARVRTSGTTIFVCAECHHGFWEGSHTAHVRERVARVLGPP